MILDGDIFTINNVSQGNVIICPSNIYSLYSIKKFELFLCCNYIFEKS